MDDVEDRVLAALPEHGEANVFALYEEIDISPDRFMNALESLHERGEIFYPKRYHVQRLDEGDS